MRRSCLSLGCRPQRDRRCRKVARVALAATALLLPLPALLRAQEKREPPLFVGETLRYAMTILGVAGGELTLSALATELDGRPAYKFELSALSNDFLSKFFLVRDTMVSWIDPKTFRSLRFEKHTIEGKRARDELTEFDYERGIARHEGKEISLGDASLDSLSSVYYLRTLGLEGDKPIDLQVFSGERQALRVEIQKRETIKTPAGTFETIRVEPKSAGGHLLGKNLVLWLTDDARKVPVQLSSKLKVGKLVGKLKAIERTEPVR